MIQIFYLGFILRSEIKQYILPISIQPHKCNPLKIATPHPMDAVFFENQFNLMAPTDLTPGFDTDPGFIFSSFNT